MLQLTKRFPFPFEEDQYKYSNNMKPLDPPFCIQITAEYMKEIEEKRYLIDNHPERVYHSLSTSIEAQWEIVDLVIHQLAEGYPTYFSLAKNNDEWTFHNHLLNETETFVFGDTKTLSIEPLNFIGRHVQEDLLLMAQRDGDIYLDAGQLCFPSAWSLTFNLGMSFLDIHTPVPWDAELGEKIRRFIVHVETGKPWVRVNWAMHVGGRLDLSPETFDVWGPARYQVTLDEVPYQVYLRVEEQTLSRLPRSNALLFTIHTYQIPLKELVENTEWLRQLHGVLTTLPEKIADYKGMSAYRDVTIQYLESCL
jgi:hypothetical protein